MSILSYRKIILVIFIGCTISLGVGLYARLKHPKSEVVQAALQVPVVLSMHLNIPRINVNAAIESVGVTPEGAMGAPQGPADTAWLNLGAVPGAVGTAVIDGHSGWAHNTPAVFDNLHQLQKGDSIIVTDARGVAITFIVREMHSYDPTADAAAVFTSTDNKSHLNLITCAGDWNPVLKTHSQRLVVFADKKS